MQFFIDSADIDEIQDALSMGMCDGVTTNPSLVAKTGKPFRKVIDAILDIVDGPVSLEVTTLSYDEIMAQARELAAIAENVVVKLPLTPPGLKACRTCYSEGIATNVTLCFSPTQALLAAKAGATYISPFVGRLDDISSDGMRLIEEILSIYEHYEFETQVLVASVRHPQHLAQAAAMGAHVATIPHKVIGQLFKHPLTDLGLDQFMADWKKVPAG
ncbi:MAG: fructose-6-phosphate aldolase [Deltaproteobacteria bacterium]|nr:fructose-6-phosphate aldolase [Deltaproteobacteria bacterium]